MDQLIAGRYQLLDRIAAGGMGSVWQAWDRRLERRVAVKVLGEHDGKLLLRFVREQALRINHPHVLAPYGWAAEDSNVVLAMDLVRGGSVRTLLGDHGPLPDAYVAVLMGQLLEALEAVHATGVVHRDVKPDNLLLEPTGTGRPHLRLADFGIAAVTDEPRLTHTSMSIGTLGYMAPEQAAGAEPDPRHDLFAAGIVGKQMITDCRPRDLPQDWPSRLWPFLERLTSPDPEARPATASEAIALLAALGPPAGAPWESQPDPPEVFDQLAPPDDPPTDGPLPEPVDAAASTPSATRTRIRPATPTALITDGHTPDRRRAVAIASAASLLLALALLITAVTVWF